MHTSGIVSICAALPVSEGTSTPKLPGRLGWRTFGLIAMAGTRPTRRLLRTDSPTTQLQEQSPYHTFHTWERGTSLRMMWDSTLHWWQSRLTRGADGSTEVS